VITTEAKKKDYIPSAPYPTKAEMDYSQNGLVLPKDPKNLELLFRDVHQKGFLDLELLYQLKQKEMVRGIEREIADRIENPLEERLLCSSECSSGVYPRRSWFYGALEGVTGCFVCLLPHFLRKDNRFDVPRRFYFIS